MNNHLKNQIHNKNYFEMTTYWHIIVRGRVLKPTQGVPYEFKTYEEAEHIVGLYYGLESLKKDVEIIEVNPYLKIK